MKIGALLLVIAIPACCILLPLLTVGALAGIGGWFLDGPGLALIAAAGVATIVYLLWRWRRRSGAVDTVESKRGVNGE